VTVAPPAPARTRADRAPTVPFTVIDEAVLLLDTPWEPWSVQLEVRAGGRLDEDRLRAAVGTALRRHPMALARMLPARKRDHRYGWELTAEPDVDPLRVVECPDDAALVEARSELYSLAVPLAESPPLRLRLARHPGGDLLMVGVNHVAFDGFGAVRLLQSVARAYTGDPDPADPVDLAEARDVHRHLAAPDTSVRALRRRALARKLADLAVRPARLAPEGGTDRPGYGFHHLALAADRTAALAAQDLAGTVNDRLVAALHLAVAAWNRARGERARHVGVLVPVNLRPHGWQHDVVTNFVLDARVATTARHHASPRLVLEAVVAESERIKAGSGAALIEVLGRSPTVPLWAKEPMSAALWLTGNRLVDTAVLSNLGRLDELPGFGPEAPEAPGEIWFSAPARMPCGLSIGAVTVGGRLHLAFRYRHPVFDAAGAGRFAACYLEALARVVEAARG
jgi:NRPS condensation-like uncharacterized protein